MSLDERHARLRVDSDRSILKYSSSTNAFTLRRRPELAEGRRLEGSRVNGIECGARNTSSPFFSGLLR